MATRNTTTGTIEFFVSSCMIELAGVDIQLFQKLAWEIPVFKEKRVVA